MHKVSVPHGDIFTSAKSFGMLSTKNGLVAAKLAKIRRAIVTESKDSAEGFDTVAKEFATLDEDGKPIVLMMAPERSPEQIAADEAAKKEAPKPEKQFFQLTGTPAYEMTDEKKEAFEEARKAFLETETEVDVPQLTEQDMAWVICAGPGGQELPIPPFISDVLHRFGPEF
jgi:hypothetical protein